MGGQGRVENDVGREKSRGTSTMSDGREVVGRERWMVDEGRAEVECCGDRNGSGHCHDCGDGDNVSAVSSHCSERRCDRRRRRSRGRRRVHSQIKPGLGRCNGQWDVNIDQCGHGRSDGYDGGRRGSGCC